ncbi:MAG: endonuclease III [Deltaproteobacteria bacterium]|nr:MAG: endonuclease III [Deltaproteobacteria bacterium]
MPAWRAPVVAAFARERRDPFSILVSCLLSLRTRDETTGPASRRLFRLARTPAALLRLSPRTIERAIYPVGFYRTKARTLRALARLLLERHRGGVPADLDALLALPGVGRKTANLVLTDAFGLPGICVDTHVHRITNRWGYVATRTPAATEMALREKLPRREWRGLNTLLVAFGQTICRPMSPHCSICPLDPMCPRRGVGPSR